MCSLFLVMIVELIFLKSISVSCSAGVCPGAFLFRPWHYVQKINLQCLKSIFLLSRSARSFLFLKEQLYCTSQSVRGIHFALLVMERA